MVGSLRRVFAAVPLPDEIRLALADELDSLSIPGRVVPPGNWHVTLRFLGKVDDPTLERFVAALDSAELGDPFRVGLGSLGAFPGSRNATVLWVSLTGDLESLEALAATVEDCVVDAGLEAEERPFRPHLTLSRIRPPQDVTGLVGDTTLDRMRWECRELIVYQSHLGGGPARYEHLERFALGR